MNTYGDNGNLLMLQHRAKKLGYEVETTLISLEEDFNPEEFDIVMFGGGQDYEQTVVAKDLQNKKDTLIEYIEDDGVVVAICGGFQLLGRYYVNASGERLNGISAIDVCTNGQFPNRLIGDVEIFNEEFGETYLGYENHIGRTFFVRSSAANIPVNMQLCKDLGLDEDSYSVSIPLGATINMAGAAITITVLTLAAVNTLGIQVDFLTALVLSVLSTIAACGASGVTGGSLLLIPVACSLFGISNDIAMQVVGVGFIIGVLQDSCETALNSSTDVLFTAAAEFRQWKKEGRNIQLNPQLAELE